MSFIFLFVYVEKIIKWNNVYKIFRIVFFICNVLGIVLGYLEILVNKIKNFVLWSWYFSRGGGL